VKEIKFIHSNCQISQKDIDHLGKKLKKEIEQMNIAKTKDYNDNRASINLPDDEENIELVKTLANKKLLLKPKYIVIVGIGGSNLGTIAIQEAILGKLFNLTNPNLKVLYADTVDPDQIYNIISIIEPDLKKGENIIINVVSKSGGTTETIANFEVLLKVLKKYKKNYNQYIVVTTDKHSNFWKLALDEEFETLEIPKKVGGRFSVFSSVSLFPLCMLGIDIDLLLKGARIMRDKCIDTCIYSNLAALSASMIYQHRLNGIAINDIFLFSSDLEHLGKWYRQLIGESIGKEFDNKKKRVLEGITPTVSIGSTDLHSVGQLYLGGPYDKFTTFVKIIKYNKIENIPNYPKYSDLVKGIQSRSINEIMDAIYTGMKRAFKKGKRPFVEIVLPDKSAYSIGQFLQFKEMEIMYLGYLLNVNPFDQPNVELYKMETRMILHE
jgi:glucose-6-phosphate isomerase